MLFTVEVVGLVSFDFEIGFLFFAMFLLFAALCLFDAALFPIRTKFDIIKQAY